MIMLFLNYVFFCIYNINVYCLLQLLQKQILNNIINYPYWPEATFMKIGRYVLRIKFLNRYLIFFFCTL